MSASNPSPNIRAWAPGLDERTVMQAARTARPPFLAGPLALMHNAYKHIETVLAQQANLVRVTHRLTQFLNYKG
jgi:hypothetical protein